MEQPLYRPHRSSMQGGRKSFETSVGYTASCFMRRFYGMCMSQWRHIESFDYIIKSAVDPAYSVV